MLIGDLYSAFRPRTMLSLKSIANRAIQVSMGQAGALVPNLLQSVLVARILGPDQFGIWAMLLSAQALVVGFASFRTAESLTAFWVDPEYATAERRRALAFSAIYADLGTRLLTSLIVVVSMPVYFRTFAADHAPSTLIIILAAAAQSIGFLTPTWMALIRAERRIGLLAVFPPALAWLGLLLMALALGVLGHNLASVAVAFLATECAGFTARMITLRASLKRWLQGRPAWLAPRATITVRHRIQRFWSMMTAGYFSSCLSSLMKEADVLLFGAIGSATQTGQYRLAKSLVSMFQLGIRNVGTIIVQDFADVAATDNHRAIQSLIRTYAVPLGLIVAAGAAVAAIAIGPFLSLAYGRDFYAARIPFWILLPGVATATALFWVNSLAIALQLGKRILQVTFINFAVFIVVLAVGIPIAGAMAAAVALSTAWIVGHVMLLHQVRRTLELRVSAAA